MGECLFLKGQFSLELFLSMSFFVLVLLWFYNYQQQLSSEDLLYGQQKALLKQVVLLSGEAFYSGENVTFTLPCLMAQGKPVQFWIYGGHAEGGGIVNGAKEISLFAPVYSKNQKETTTFFVATAPVNAPVPLVFTCVDGTSGKLSMSRGLFSGPFEHQGAVVEGVILSKAS